MPQRMPETMVRVFVTSFQTSETMGWALEISGQMAEVVVFSVIASSLWKQKVRTGLCSNDGTHANDLKNLVGVQLPGGDRLFVVLCMKVLIDRIPFTPFD